MAKRTNSGKNLQKKWNVKAAHALYREDGKFYMPLTKFPGAFFDKNGYILFDTEKSYLNHPSLRISKKRVNITNGISSIEGYIRKNSTEIPNALGESKRSNLPTTETRKIYRPDDFALAVDKLIPDWKQVASDTGYLRVRPTVEKGIIGLCGSLSLGNPPSPIDIDDALEASKPKDCWDYHSFLDFVTVPVAGPSGNLEVVLFHPLNSFADRPLEIVDRIQLCLTSSAIDVLAKEVDEQTYLVREWDRLLIALKERYGSSDLSRQKWTVGDKVYDITFPDE